MPSDYAHLIGRSTFHHSGSDACLQVASQWLRDCLEQHPNCSGPKNRCSPSPTRLLQISAQENLVRLKDTGDYTDEYVALSYCWGGEKTLILTKDSESALRKGLPVDAFPSTLRDALVTTKTLNYSFIWIDALCIFQDSAEDWKLEASRMRDVYSNAIVTLNAATAARMSDGMFAERSGSGPKCRLRWHTETAIPEYLYLRAGSDFADMTLRTSHTTSRSWTLQESLLAPRTINFGSQQLSFECVEGRFDEAGRHTRSTQEYSSKAFMQAMFNEKPGWRTLARYARLFGIPPVVHIPYYSVRQLWSKQTPDMASFGSHSHLTLHFQGVLRTPGGLAFTYYDQWREIVKHYTLRSLTHESDVLPALSGLAEEFRHITGGDAYVAGMWRGDLIRSLNWLRMQMQTEFRDGKIINVRAPKEYLAPSWSWASVLGSSTVFLGSAPCQDETRVTSKVKIEEVYLESDGNGPFGKVKSGYLTLAGPVLDINSPVEMPNQPDNLTATHEYLKDLTTVAEFGCEFLQKHEPFHGQQFCLLHLCNDRDLSDHFRRKGYLLLESCPDGSWKRLGNFGLRKAGPSWKKEKIEWPAERNEDVRLELESAKWERRTITII